MVSGPPATGSMGVQNYDWRAPSPEYEVVRGKQNFS